MWIDAFKLCCWRRLLRVLWMARRSNQSILKEISPEYTGRTGAEASILWPCDGKNWLIGKDPDSGKNWRQEEKGTTEDEMVGWHHWLNWHEFQQAPGVGDGQGSLACCSPWGCKELDTTEQLNWTEGKNPRCISRYSVCVIRGLCDSTKGLVALYGQGREKMLALRKSEF